MGNRRFCLIDFETWSLADLPECGAWRYAEDWSTEILCAAFGEEGKPYLYTEDNRDARYMLKGYALDPEVIFIAFNVQFERAIWHHCMVPMGFPPLSRNRWHDIQATCAMRGLPLDLDNCLKALGLPGKDMEGNKLIKQLSNHRIEKTPEVLERIYTYAMSDWEVEWNLHNTVGFLPKSERKVWLVNQAMNDTGMCLDPDFIDACQLIIDKAVPPMVEEFKRMTGLTPTQSMKLKQWCHENGAPLPDLKQETVERALKDGELPEHVAEALELRALCSSSSIAKLGRMKAVINEDGRARGACQYHGTLPGRSAGRLFQPYNFPRGTVKVDGEAPDPDVLVNVVRSGDPELVEQLIGPPVKTIVSGLRHCILAEKGKTLIAGDYAGIQARVVLALAGQHEKTAIMAAGKDIYIDMAETIYKVPVDKKKDPEKRHIGKCAVLGLGFGMGAPKFNFQFAPKETRDMCERVVTTYRKEWAPGVPYLWYALEDASARAVHNPGKRYQAQSRDMAYPVFYQMEGPWLTCTLPSGRKLWYYDAQPDWQRVPWNDEVKRAWTYRAWKFGHMQRIHPFGGSITENVVMGIEVDIHRKGMQNLHKAGWPIVLEVYDEIVCEMPRGDERKLAEQFEAMMLDQDEWVHQLRVPIATEVWTGERYRK
jgi:DNA polymerase